MSRAHRKVGAYLRVQHYALRVLQLFCDVNLVGVFVPCRRTAGILWRGVWRAPGRFLALHLFLGTHLRAQAPCFFPFHCMWSRGWVKELVCQMLLGVPSISILSRDPSFQEAIQKPRETFLKRTWLKRMDKEPTPRDRWFLPMKLSDEAMGALAPCVPGNAACFWERMRGVGKSWRRLVPGSPEEWGGSYISLYISNSLPGPSV